MQQEAVIQILFGSSVIAAFITAIFAFIKSDKQGKLEHITLERKNWRESMRSIMEEIQGASYQETLNCMVKLKVRINAYGSNCSHNYMDDAHIWKLIKKIEKMDCNNTNELHKCQNQIIEYISLLLKYDWERSKREVKGDKLNGISFCFFAASVIYFIYTVGINLNISLERLRTEEYTLLKVSLCVIMLILILLYNYLPIAIFDEQFKYDRKDKKLVRYYLKNTLTIFLSLTIYTLCISYVYSQISYWGMDKIFIYCVICAFIYILGEVFKFLSSRGKIEEIYRYENAIELINNSENNKNQKKDESIQSNKESMNTLYYSGVFPLANNIIFIIYYVISLVTLPMLYWKKEQTEVVVAGLACLAIIITIIVIKIVETLMKKRPNKKTQWMTCLEKFSLDMSILVYLLTSFSYMSVVVDKNYFCLTYFFMLGLFFVGTWFDIVKPLVKSKCRKSNKNKWI